MRVALVAALGLALTACGAGAGDDAAQAACRAYGHAPPDRATADKRAKRAGEADAAYAGLKRDMDDAWKRADAMAAAHNSGPEVSADDLNASFAADKQVRADCADAGADLGPLKP